MLYYLPLEPYVERYTYFMSSKEGWAETFFNKYNVPFVRVEGANLGQTIKDGVVLDACGRSYYAMSQIMKLVKLINDGFIKDEDVIYLEDFWHPGVESLFYIRQLKGMKFKIGTFIHAQSVDDTDFAWKMKSWMRPIEQGYGQQYDYIFTCSHILKQLCIVAGVAKEDNIFHVGLPYNSDRLIDQLTALGFTPQAKDNSVIFASRFDDEKDPMFFLDVVEACPDIQFKLVNPRKDRPITSNQEVLSRLNNILATKKNLKLIDTSNKLAYYTELSKSSVIFNCANQDWVSWTLLEGITFGCNPLYPIWKDFEYELQGDTRYLYPKRDLKVCVDKLYKLIQTPFDFDFLSKIVDKHDESWLRYLQIMELAPIVDDKLAVIEAQLQAVEADILQNNVPVVETSTNQPTQVVEQPTQLTSKIDVPVLPEEPLKITPLIKKPLFGPEDVKEEPTEKARITVELEEKLRDKFIFNPDTGFHLYFAGQQAPEIDIYLQRRNIFRLFSQVNERKGIQFWQEENCAKNLFVDSGAFSVAHSNKTVDLDQYIEYINNNADIPIFVELDEIPYPVLNTDTALKSSEGSWRNYLYMKERVTSPCHLLPLYHFGEPKDALKRILNTPVGGKLPEYIGIGGRHGVSMDVQCKYFNEIFAIIQRSDNPNVKVHVFGMTVLSALEKFPFYSADSTTWLQLGINGNINTSEFGIINVSDRSTHIPNNIVNLPKDVVDRIEAYLEAHGYTIDGVRMNYKERLLLNIDTMVEWAQNYQYKGPKTFTSRSLF